MTAHQTMNSTGGSSYSVDIDLHPTRTTLWPGQTTVSKYELEGIYEIVSKINAQRSFLVSENEHLLTQLQQAKASIEDLRRDLVAKEQTESFQRCQINHLESELAKLKSPQQHLDESETGTEAEAKLRDVERGLVEASRQREITETCKRLQEMEQRLKQVESLNELLLLEKKSLQSENKKLASKLKILTDSGEDENGHVTVTKCGRFEVQKRQIECARCHQAFGSKAEMQASSCYYHLSVPYLAESKKGTQVLWRCCSNASFRKMSKGCQKGKHVVSNKRARMEE